MQTIAAIKEVADYYQISSSVDGCTISPLHYIFATYIKQADMEDKLLEKIQKIEPEVTNIHKLVLLAKQGRNPRVIEADSFLDGGVFLLWCLMNKRYKLLEHLLAQNMI